MKKILVVPMNWGLGHATRCVPIIRDFINEGCKVYISGSGESGTWLQDYFPELEFLQGCPDYGVFYPEKIGFLSWLKQWPRWEKAIAQENKWLNEKQSEFQFDVVISDNRFGIWLDDAENIFITHQLNPILPALFKVLYQWAFWRRMKNFQKIWVPDVEGELSLSGQLSSVKRSDNRVERIGWLSRFSEVNEQTFESYDWVGIVSGPEMHRTLFELDLLDKMKSSKLKCLLITGQPTQPRDVVMGNVHIRHHLEDEYLAYVLRRAQKITSRSGYSSLMDYKALGVKAEVIPTPRQTEQEYLAKRWLSL
jgi:predicted glycosyltransferase